MQVSSGVRGKNWEKERGRIGPGAMVSKEEEAVKKSQHGKCQPGKQIMKKDEKEPDAKEGEPLSLCLEAGECCEPGGLRRWLHVRQPQARMRQEEW